MKTTSLRIPLLSGRRLRAPEQVRARDWSITFALCMGVAGLVLMFILFWL